MWLVSLICFREKNLLDATVHFMNNSLMISCRRFVFYAAAVKPWKIQNQELYTVVQFFWPRIPKLHYLEFKASFFEMTSFYFFLSVSHLKFCLFGVKKEPKGKTPQQRLNTQDYFTSILLFCVCANSQSLSPGLWWL